MKGAGGGAWGVREVGWRQVGWGGATWGGERYGGGGSCGARRIRGVDEVRWQSAGVMCAGCMRGSAVGRQVKRLAVGVGWRARREVGKWGEVPSSQGRSIFVRAWWLTPTRPSLSLLGAGWGPVSSAGGWRQPVQAFGVLICSAVWRVSRCACYNPRRRQRHL
jgi:hypothetical protein